MDIQIHDQELLEGFFLDVDESFSPQVAQGMALARQGELAESVDMMMRPLHTIKGAAAFLGLEEISAYAHKVEDLLKALQNGDAKPDAAFMMRCVDMLFTLLERARQGQPLAGAGHEELLRAMENGGLTNASTDSELQQTSLDGVTVLAPIVQRIHLPKQAKPLLDALEALPDGAEALIDLSAVRTLNSTTWGALWTAAGRLRLHVAGMSQMCRSTFAAWGFDARIQAHADADAFQQRRRES